MYDYTASKTAGTYIESTLTPTVFTYGDGTSYTCKYVSDTVCATDNVNSCMTGFNWYAIINSSQVLK